MSGSYMPDLAHGLYKTRTTGNFRSQAFSATSNKGLVEIFTIEDITSAREKLWSLGENYGLLEQRTHRTRTELRTGFNYDPFASFGPINGQSSARIYRKFSDKAYYGSVQKSLSISYGDFDRKLKCIHLFVLKF